MLQRFLEPTFMDKNFNDCLRNTLAACFAFCKWIWDVCGATSFSWMCMMFFDNWFDSFSTTNWNQFFLPSCICVFWKLHVVLQQLHGREECFWNLWEVWDGFGTFEVNSAHVNSPQWKWTTVWMWMDENLFFVFRCHCQDGKAETRTTQHSAWCMTDNQDTSLCFLCGKELSDWCSENRCFWGFVFCFKHSTWRRPTPLRLRATSGCN